MNRLFPLAASGLLLAMAHPALAQAAAGEARPAPATKFSTTIFVNASDRQHEGRSSADEGLAVDLKRLFLRLDHRFNEQWSAQFMTDVQWHRNSDPTDIWLRHAYLERKLGNGAQLQIGSAPTPWIAQESREGFRYVDPQLIAMNRMGAAADYGIHIKGRQGQVSYAASLVTGAGFQRPRLGKRPDVEVRVGWFPVKSVELAAGAYHGTRAQDAGSREREHTAQRWNLMASWVGERGRAGVQYFRADNWTQVVRPEEDASNGWSAWGSYRIAPQWTAFARHDRTRMSRRLDPSREQRYHQLGVEWKQGPHLRLGLVGKRTTLDSDARNTRTNEAGVWAMLSY
ncbi:hypothetical protein [Luteimonas sp. e5]